MELSEQSQLEAAIQASLQDCHATKKSSKYELIFSDSDSDGGGGENDHIYLSSDSNSDMDETDGGWIHSSDDVHLVSDTNLQVHTSTMSMATIDSPASLKPPMDSNSNVKTKPINSHVKSLLEDVPPQQTRRNRKRTSSPSSSQDECPRKVPRSNTTDSISDGSHHSAAISHSSTCRSNGPVKAQSPRKSKRNKQNNADDDEQQQMLSSDTTDVEKLLETGAIGKDEVSHILFRLPDGTRLQKAFICSHPIKVISNTYMYLIFC